MYEVTFFGQTSQERLSAAITVDSLDTLKVIVLSSANIMVEWKDEMGYRWGDACNGKAVTQTLDCLLKGLPLPYKSVVDDDGGEYLVRE